MIQGLRRRSIYLPKVLRREAWKGLPSEAKSCWLWSSMKEWTWDCQNTLEAAISTSLIRVIFRLECAAKAWNQSLLQINENTFRRDLENFQVGEYGAEAPNIQEMRRLVFLMWEIWIHLSPLSQDVNARKAICNKVSNLFEEVLIWSIMPKWSFNMWMELYISI